MAFMAALAPIFMVASQVVQGVSAIKQADAAEEAALFNAETQMQNAGAAREKAAEDERQYRVYSRKALGDIRSGYAASGVSLEGSAMDVLSEGAATAELDALRIRHGGELAARGYENEATYQRMKAKAAKQGGYLAASGNFLSAGGYLAGGYNWGGTKNSPGGKLTSGSAGGGGYPGQDWP